MAELLRRLSSAGRGTGAALLLGGLAAVAFLGGRASVDAVSAASEGPSATAAQGPPVWETKTESIGRSLAFVGEIAAVTTAGPLVNVEGMVTGLPLAAEALVEPNTRLLEVDLRPVVAGQGDIPAFRDLQAGDVGADVGQVRDFLCDLGRLRECRANDTFTPAMVTAVQAWQKQHGLPTDGRVRVSDIMWFPALPVSARASSDVAVGTRVASSDRPVDVVAGAPVLTIRASRDQAALVPPGSVVRFGSGGQGVVGPAAAAGPGQGGEQASPDAVVLEVRTADGGAGACTATDQCQALLQGRSSVSVDVSVEVVPERSGVGVPVRALLTRADGSSYVSLADGGTAPVTVVGTSGGIALVEGLKVGQRVLLSGAASA